MAGGPTEPPSLMTPENRDMSLATTCARRFISAAGAERADVLGQKSGKLRK
jgi:hypothetical protein